MYVLSPNMLHLRLILILFSQAGYSVILDGNNTFQADASTDSTTEYNTLLYSATSLDTTKEHQIVLRNVQSSSGASLDIDHLLITAGDGDAGYVEPKGPMEKHPTH